MLYEGGFGHPSAIELPSGGLALGGQVDTTGLEGGLTFGVPGAPRGPGVAAGAGVSDQPVQPGPVDTSGFEGQLTFGIPGSRPATGGFGFEGAPNNDNGVPRGFEEAREAALRQQAREAARKQALEQEQEQIDRLARLERQARERGADRSAGRIQRQRERIEKRRADREARRQRLDDFEKRQQEEARARRERREQRRRERQQKREEEIQRARDAAARRRAAATPNFAGGGYIIDVTDKSAPEVYGYGPEFEKVKAQFQGQVGNTANTLLLPPGAPGGPATVGGWIAQATYAVQSLQAMNVGAFGGQGQFLNAPASIVHKSVAPATSTIGQWLVGMPGTVTTSRNPAVQFISRVEAPAGSQVQVGGTGGIVNVTRQHSGDGTIVDVQPGILIQDLTKKPTADAIAVGADRRFAVTASGGAIATGVTVAAPPGSTGSIAVGTKDAATGNLIGTPGWQAFGTGTQAIGQIVSDPDPDDTRVLLYALGDTLYMLPPGGTPVAWGSGGGGTVTTSGGNITGDGSAGSPITLSSTPSVTSIQIGGGQTLSDSSGVLTVGDGSGTAFQVDGDQIITGKLTVAGLIDPTGYVFAGQASAPTGADALTLWMDSTNNRVQQGTGARDAKWLGYNGLSQTDSGTAAAALTTVHTVRLNGTHAQDSGAGVTIDLALEASLVDVTAGRLAAQVDSNGYVEVVLAGYGSGAGSVVGGPEVAISDYESAVKIRGSALSLQLPVQASNPAAPSSSSFVGLFAKSDGIYCRLNSGTVMGPFDAPGGSTLTTRGDLLTRDASTNVRLAIGTADYLLTSDGTDPAWVAPSFKSSLFRVKDSTDATKLVALDLSGLTTATTRTYVAPDANGTLALTSDLSAYQPLDDQLTDLAGLSYAGNAGLVLAVNATEDGLEWVAQAAGGTPHYSDADFQLYYDLDDTKNITFDLSNLTAARTIRFPDVGGTLLRDPTTTRGDIIWRSGVNSTGALSRLAVGAAHTLLASDGTDPSWSTLSSLIDGAIGSTRGSVLYRGASGWAALAPATAGYVLTDGGAGADPSWAAAASGGTITADSPLTGDGSSGDHLRFSNQSANTVLAGPSSGAAGAPTFRALVSDDIPDLSATYLTTSSAWASVATPAASARTVTIPAGTLSATGQAIKFSGGVDTSDAWSVTVGGTTVLSGAGGYDIWISGTIAYVDASTARVNCVVSDSAGNNVANAIDVSVTWSSTIAIVLSGGAHATSLEAHSVAGVTGGGGAGTGSGDDTTASLWIPEPALHFHAAGKALYTDTWFGDGDAIASLASIANSYSRVLTQTTAGMKPTYAADVGDGKPGIVFDGGDFLYNTSSGSWLTGALGEVWAVITIDSDPSTWTGGAGALLAITNYSSGTANLLLLQIRSDGAGGAKLGIFQQQASAGSDLVIGDTVMAVGGRYLVCFYSTGTAYGMRVNGTEQALSVSSGSNTGDWFGDTTHGTTVIGAYYENTHTSGNQLFQGKLHELIVFDGVSKLLNREQARALTKRLSDRWGLELPDLY